MRRAKASVDWAAPVIVQRGKVHPALALTHVPKVGRATVELRVRPRPPHAVMMDVVRRKIVGHQFSGEGSDGMEISAAPKDWLDVIARERARLRLIIEQWQGRHRRAACA